MYRLGYHNHNFYCDGKEIPELYVQNAINQGFKAIGFSSHAPFFFDNKWSIKQENLKIYAKDIRNLTNIYENIRIHLALEIDYLPKYIHPFTYFQELLNLDYTIGSIHYVMNPKTGNYLFIDGPQSNFLKGVEDVFDNNFRFMVESYFNQTIEMIENEKPDIVGHIDKIILNTHNQILTNNEYPIWYDDIVEKTLKVAVQNNSIIELNLRGLIKGKWNSTFINERFLPLCKSLGVQMVVSADAHHPDEIGKFYDFGIDLLKSAGYQHIMEFENSKWKVCLIED